MNKKILIIIIVVILAVIVAVGAFALGAFGQTTQVDSKFISGTISGVAVENDSNIPSGMGGWAVGYNDTENNVSYAFAMVDSFNFTKEMFIHAGLKKIATKEYNGVNWDIYPVDPKSNPILNGSSSGYMMFASGKTGEYVIAVSSNTVNSDSSLNSDLFTNYVEPLLSSITLKDPQNPPKEYQFMNVTESDYNLVKNFVKTNGWSAITSSL